MNNFEWIKNDDETLKCALAYNWGVNKKTGEVGKCRDILCKNCIFREFAKGCDDLRWEWLKEEYVNLSLYEEGDVVISKKGNIYIVFHEGNGDLKNDLLVASDYTAFELGLGFYICKNAIKRKVGNVFESEE